LETFSKPVHVITDNILQKLSKFAKPTVDFTDIMDAIKAKRDLFDSKLRNAKAYEPTIEKLNKEIEELNVGLETYVSPTSS